MVAILRPEKTKDKDIEDLLEGISIFKKKTDTTLPNAVMERLQINIRTDYNLREEQKDTTDYNLSRYVSVKRYEVVNCDDDCDCDNDVCFNDCDSSDYDCDANCQTVG